MVFKLPDQEYQAQLWEVQSLRQPAADSQLQALTWRTPHLVVPTMTMVIPSALNSGLVHKR